MFVTDKSHQTPLPLATMNERETIVELLLEKGAKIEAKDEDGWTPLSWAAANRHEAIAKMLLDKGANIKSTDEDHQTWLEDEELW